ncbi:MAG: 2-amino-4-hydroxy-6-hydroxymethyldihydropteridine diphosphokinase [Chitinophagaceae bacterium]|nr:2-amino-4-hydroxy-6-hydroxymethyldihydropteridine diphosphokinase [Anaerolineae bacterium]
MTSSKEDSEHVFKTMPIVYVSLGSNIEPEVNLRAAVNALGQKTTLMALSSIYQTPPYGNLDQPDFLDIVVKLATPLFPASFKMEVLDVIEHELGRVRTPQNKYGPLTIDMDILLWGASAFTFGTKPWRVPSTGILKFAAVAIPLAEISPNLPHPETGETFAQIAARLDATGIKKLDWKIE